MCLAHKKHSIIFCWNEWPLSLFAFDFFPLCFLANGMQHHGLEDLCCHFNTEDRIEGKWDWGRWKKRKNRNPLSFSHVFQGSQGKVSDKQYSNLEWTLVTGGSLNLNSSKGSQTRVAVGSVTGTKQQNQMGKESLTNAFSSSYISPLWSLAFHQHLKHKGCFWVTGLIFWSLGWEERWEASGCVCFLPQRTPLYLGWIHHSKNISRAPPK